MAWIKTKVKSIVSGMNAAIRDDAMRKELMFEWLNILLAFISFWMTVVNIFTKEYVLMLSTALFSAACIGNAVLVKQREIVKRILYVAFAVETLVLLAFFLISGIPNGFSALWMCLVPSFSLLIFGRKPGTYYSIATFLMLLFFFWFPWGQQLLHYHYTDEFMLRFPFLYAACYLLALSVEIVRAQTQKQLLESEQKYYYLYRHDALTGLNNRYGFNALVDEDYAKRQPGKVGMMIIDIDEFKRINDQYGHNNGDIVLRGIAEIIEMAFCDETIYCRWGGEEYTIYMHCGHDYEEAAENLRSYVENAEFRSSEGEIMRVTVSVGVCISQSVESTSVATLVNQADKCLYRAKDKGRNCVVSTELP